MDSSLCYDCYMGLRQKYETTDKQIEKKLSILYDLAKRYEENTWTSVLDHAMKSIKPLRKKGLCTLGIVSPFSGQLEWIAIPCRRRLNMSNVVCYKRYTAPEVIVLHSQYNLNF